MNLVKLNQLAERTRVPIYTLCARHGVPETKNDLEVGKMKADDFRGMEAELLMCVGARVLLTQNLWVEAGHMNGSFGILRGFIWPEKLIHILRKLNSGRLLCVC